MSVSMPSRQAYIIDVPEVNDLRVEFRYNYFVSDEGAIDDGGIDSSLVTVPSDELNASFARYASTRSPRFNILKWSPPGTANSRIVNRDLIRKNLSRIIAESDASSFSFFTTTFNDANHAAKMWTIVSGTLLQASMPPVSNGAYSGASDLVKRLPHHIDGEKIIDALTQPIAAFGGRFFTRDGSETTQDIPTPPSFAVTLNAKFASEIFERSINDPQSQNGSDISVLFSSSIRLASVMKRQALNGPDDKDNQLMIDPIFIDANRGSDTGTAAEVIGYVIDKYEHLSTGDVVLCDQIIIENATVGETLDFKIKYGATYSYTIKTIALLQGPGVDSVTQRIASVGYLASSRSSNRQIVECIEMVAPPAPSDIQPIWDYENSQMLLTWQYPINTQRDIKAFQIFRRSSIDHPFELIRHIDFNDAIVKDSRTVHVSEPNIDRTLVQNLTDAVTSFIDPEFNRRSSYIYTVCCIDAHGLTSNYGIQVQISFDEFKNSIVLKHVSRSGAPKAYPNMYLNQDAFVDTMRTTGGANRGVRVYLNPETYSALFSDGRSTQTLLFKQQNARYALQLINLDRQQSQRIDITIDDRAGVGFTVQRNATVNRLLTQR